MGSRLSYLQEGICWYGSFFICALTFELACTELYVRWNVPPTRLPERMLLKK